MTTAWLAGAENPALPMNPRFERMLELTVGNTYGDFVRLVAEARKLPVSVVEKLAEGRVYTGRQAKELGLADELGGVQSAVDLAKGLAKLSKDAPEYVYTPDDEPLLSWVKGVATRILAEVAPVVRVGKEGRNAFLQVLGGMSTLGARSGSFLAVLPKKKAGRNTGRFCRCHVAGGIPEHHAGSGIQIVIPDGLKNEPRSRFAAIAGESVFRN